MTASTSSGGGPPGRPPDDLGPTRPDRGETGAGSPRAGPVDAYESPPDMREAVEITAPFEIFPWGTAPSSACDLDHTDRYVSPPDGEPPPGQTRPGNLGPSAGGTTT